MSRDNVEAILATALRDLVSYVDTREETSAADDDVRALEDVAAVLHGVDPDDLDRLTTLLGPQLSFEMGLSDH